MSSLNEQVAGLMDVQRERYLERHAGSREILDRLAIRLPLGVASSFQDHAPHPLVIDRAAGTQVWDVDGNELMDLHGGFGANVFGHAHPAILAALISQAQSGAHYAYPTPALEAYVEHLCVRFGMDQIRLCNSGTEATMDAIRLARGFTGRDRIVRMEGSYHGHHDTVLVSMKPLLSAVGDPPRPGVWANSEGLPASVLGDVIPLSFNDADTLEEVLATEQPAAVIIEPILCNLGLVRPQDDYLRRVRDACTRHGVVLIWDQVKTGATVAWAGASELWPDVLPDLHCLGKAIGGGLPVGAYGGRGEIMDLVSDGRVPGYGTFNGNPLTVAAGLAALTEVLTPAAYEHLDALNRRMLPRLGQLIEEYELPCHVGAAGAKGGVFFAPRPPRDYREYLQLTDHGLALCAWTHMANQGILLAPGSDEQWTLPVVLSFDQADQVVAAFARFCEDLRR
jgi:glutamate-1-semialdehyde 2,1-aminomutase